MVVVVHVGRGDLSCDGSGLLSKGNTIIFLSPLSFI